MAFGPGSRHPHGTWRHREPPPVAQQLRPIHSQARRQVRSAVDASKVARQLDDPSGGCLAAMCARSPVVRRFLRMLTNQVIATRVDIAWIKSLIWSASAMLGQCTKPRIEAPIAGPQRFEHESSRVDRVACGVNAALQRVAAGIASREVAHRWRDLLLMAGCRRDCDVHGGGRTSRRGRSLAIRWRHVETDHEPFRQVATMSRSGLHPHRLSTRAATISRSTSCSSAMSWADRVCCRGFLAGLHRVCMGPEKAQGLG